MGICDYSAGLIAGIVSTSIGHPFDTIKIQQQVHSLNVREASSRICKHRGWIGFYRGLTAPLVASGIVNALFFGVYGDFKDFLIQNRIEASEFWQQVHRDAEGEGVQPTPKEILIALEKYSHLKRPKFSELFISGTIAGLCTIPIVAPIELVKIKLQSQMKRRGFNGSFHCLVTVVREAGVTGLFRGFVPTLIRDGPGNGAYVVTYEVIKRFMDTYATTSLALNSIIGGGIAGIINWAVALPFDIIKTRMQADDHVKPYYKNMQHVLKELVQKDGYLGMYRGFGSVAARAFPVNAAMFLVYESVQVNFCNR